LAAVASVVDRHTECDCYDYTALDLVAKEKRGCQPILDDCWDISAPDLFVLSFLREMKDL
jgi:hypothetical protein